MTRNSNGEREREKEKRERERGRDKMCELSTFYKLLYLKRTKTTTKGTLEAERTRPTFRGCRW